MFLSSLYTLSKQYGVPHTYADYIVVFPIRYLSLLLFYYYYCYCYYVYYYHY